MSVDSVIDELCFADYLATAPKFDCHSEVDGYFVQGTSFEQSVWVLRFSEKSDVPDKTIDFDIDLYDGSSLLDLKNSELLNLLKYFVISPLLPQISGGRFRPVNLYYKVNRAVHIIDWMLLNGERFDLVACKFSLISRFDISELLLGVAQYPVWESVYEYSSRLHDWLIEGSATLTEEDVTIQVNEMPALAVMPPEDDWSLGLRFDELLRARAWLYKNGYFQRKLGRLFFKNRDFLDEVYGNTLHGKSIAVIHQSELVIEECYEREYPGVPVRKLIDIGFDSRREASYRNIIKNIAFINSEVCDSGMSSEAIAGQVTTLQMIGVFVRDGESRYRSVPSVVLLELLRKSIEFYIQYGSLILSVVANVIKGYGLSEFNRPELDKRVGIETSSCSVEISSWSIRTTTGERMDYGALRLNPGLCELYSVLMGVTSYIIGIIGGRRQSELLGLRRKDCLDPPVDPYLPSNSRVNFNIVFDLRKSGDGTSRATIKRAVPLLVAKILWDLRGFYDQLEEAGVLKGHGELMRCLNIYSLNFSPLSTTRHNEALDLMCDYFESSTLKHEVAETFQRYYVRQHQLRRFFAQIFYWCTGPDSLDTLAFLLGHVDPEHTFRYFTEEIPGSMLLDIKHERIMAAVQEGDHTIENIDLLFEMLQSKFGTSNIQIKESSEIISDLGYLVSRGRVETTPDFDSFRQNSSVDGFVMELLATEQIDLLPSFLSAGGQDGTARVNIHLSLRVKRHGASDQS